MPFDIASYIDHTVLKPETTLADVQKVCEEAMQMHFAAACIPPAFVAAASKLLKGSGVNVATVVAFPTGEGDKEAKAAEIKAAIANGADELDMVISIDAVKRGDVQLLKEEIEACLVPVKANGKVIKLIVESGILTVDELQLCCDLYGKYPVDFMKTSTGFAAAGATVAAVQQMRANLPAEMGIKASGGIRTYEFAKELIDAGATRIGCSASMQIAVEALK